MSTATETVDCDGCSTKTYYLTLCEHHRALCPDCVAESKCRDCATEGMTRRWVA